MSIVGARNVEEGGGENVMESSMHNDEIMKEHGTRLLSLLKETGNQIPYGWMASFDVCLSISL